MIYFLVDDHGSTQLYSAEIETGAVKQITSAFSSWNGRRRRIFAGEQCDVATVRGSH